VSELVFGNPEKPAYWYNDWVPESHI